MHVQLTIDQSWWHDHMICLCAWFRPIHKKWFNLAVVDIMSCNVLIYQCNGGRQPGGHVASFRYSSSDFLAMQLLLCLWPWHKGQQWTKKGVFFLWCQFFILASGGEISDENNPQSMIERRHCLKMYSSKLACAIVPPHSHGDTQQLCNNPDGLWPHG